MAATNVVLLAADDYARLRRHAQTAFHVSELPNTVVDELGTVGLAEIAARYDDDRE
jgi:hypothetical protein